jgi:hypothetical protein
MLNNCKYSGIAFVMFLVCGLYSYDFMHHFQSIQVLQALKEKDTSDDAAKSWSMCLKELKQRVCDTSWRPAGSPKRMM